MVRDTTRPYKLCTIPDMIVRATFHDQQCTGICLTACSVVDTWEISNPSNYQAMISYIDSGTAVMTTDAKYAIYNPNIPWQAGKSLILFDADKINSINNYDGRKKKSGLNGLFDITLEDDEYETLTGRKPNGSTSINNVIENMALFNVTISNFKAGILMCLGIGLHNIPLGFQIGSNLKNKGKFNIFILTISGFIGGIISLLFKDIPESITIYLLSFTLGMLIYLTIFELLKEVMQNIKNKYTYFGFIIGIILIIILRFI